MREIKYRVFHKKLGMLNVSEIHFKITGGIYSIVTDNNEFYELSDDMIVMQFTGVKDSNDKDVFEGDIIRFGPLDYIGEIVFVDFKLVIRTTLAYVYDLDILQQNIEIIGDIHQNPEFLSR